MEKDKQPIVMEMKPGKYAWCACGLSKNQPFCDGSHQKTEHSPIITEISETKKVAWCGCRQTQHPPFCDGNHTKL